MHVSYDLTNSLLLDSTSRRPLPKKLLQELLDVAPRLSHCPDSNFVDYGIVVGSICTENNELERCRCYVVACRERE